MVDLVFVDQHNMVACLERTYGNAEFHQIFWATVKSKTVNDVKQIHATVDGKTVVISESSVRSDLYFNDEDGITCLLNDEVFENLALMGVPIPNVADEAVFKEWDDRVVRATTTAASLDAALASGDRPGCQEATGGVIAQTRRKSLDNENVSKQGRNLKTMFKEGDDFDDIDDMVNDGMENVEGYTVNIGDTVNAATTGVSAASASVTTAGVSISTIEQRTPLTTTTTAFEDEDLTIAQTLVKMRSEKAKEKGVAFRDVEESNRPTKTLPTIDPKDKEIAQKLFEEEQAQFEREQRIARERAAEQEAKDAALIEQMEDIQARMDADV
ncbi:hypothetical protein Tco_0812478 [Tanacetum coccineum]